MWPFRDEERGAERRNDLAGPQQSVARRWTAVLAAEWPASQHNAVAMWGRVLTSPNPLCPPVHLRHTQSLTDHPVLTSTFSWHTGETVLPLGLSSQKRASKDTHG